ncbi:hypothetical protein GYMLUDRAFT_247397 [Collybiopsis luxurians FD-317 M1]|uniref:Uncharacterized protein n=1 Tax=Collybiopsis luxurians FD-317 M1 TaxID=944289 RepID=A0A0D0C3B4_9AGAR|nr:hypothetical protein GYMLUDRAFT_247397 [Collybiopsis luxurians FD-317 M1]
MTSWRKMVREWELDPDKRKLNPYEPKVRGFTLHRLRHDLAREDAELIKTDLAAQAVSSQISCHQLIYQGIELEEQLRRLRYDMMHMGNNPTYLACAKLTERANSLCRRVKAFAEVQVLHMPVTAVLQQQASTSNESQAVYNLPLFLPSKVFQMNSSCEMVLLDFEWRIRYAAAHDALEQMRKHLLGRNAVLEWKNQYGHGVQEGNCSQADVERLNAKISACTSQYRMHFEILKHFAQKLGKVTWGTELCPLLDEDIRSISHGGSNNATGEGYVISSWIWNTSGVDHTDEENVTDCMSPFMLMSESSNNLEGL